MNGSDILQIGILTLFFIAFLAYGLHILAYIFGDRYVIDERLKRYGSVVGLPSETQP
jgi:hypothetical protein